MALYRMFRPSTAKKPDTAKISSCSTAYHAHAPQELRELSTLLKELWLYTLNPAGVTLSLEATRTLKRLAIERGLSPDYFILGTRAFNTDIEAIKRYRHITQRIWEYTEKLFLAWWQQWLQFRLQIFFKQKRRTRLKKRKKTLWDNLIEEEYREGLLANPKQRIPQEPQKTLWTLALNALHHIPEQASGVIPELKLQWETLYKFYTPLDKLRHKIEMRMLEIEELLESLRHVFINELEKRELHFPIEKLKKILGIFMATQVNPSDVYRRLAQQKAPIPTSREEVITNIAIKQKYTRHRQLGAILDITLLETVEHCWDLAYREVASALQEIELTLSENYNEIENYNTLLAEIMHDMLQSGPLKSHPTIGLTNIYPTAPLENQ